MEIQLMIQGEQALFAVLLFLTSVAGRPLWFRIFYTPWLVWQLRRQGPRKALRWAWRVLRHPRMIADLLEKLEKRTP